MLAAMAIPLDHTPDPARLGGNSLARLNEKWVECATTDEVVADMLIRFDKEPSARTIRTLLQAP
jgi:hypothetical protein